MLPEQHAAATGNGYALALAPGLSARSVLEKFAAVQILDVRIPTTNGHEQTVVTRIERVDAGKPLVGSE